MKYIPPYKTQIQLSNRGIKWASTRPKVGEMIIGYCIFNRCSKTGKLVSMNDMASVRWSYKHACVWNEPPLHSDLFKPERGDFMIKTTREYDDILFVGYTGTRSIFEWVSVNE